ncbi:bone morphogenetic protein 2-A [Aulostomus maculatus]
MAAAALRVWLVLALQLPRVTPLALPETRQRRGADTETHAPLHQRDSNRGGPAPHRKAPQFMLDLFNAVTANGGPRRQEEVLEGSVVRSFQDRGRVGERFHFFNLSSLGSEESLRRAEFRWFRRKHKFSLRKSFRPHFYKVDVYEVLDSQVKPWRGNLVNSRLVPLYTQGWEIFNVTQTVSKWIRNSQENNGILVVTSLPSGTWMEPPVPSARKSGQLTDANAYLVIFSDDRGAGASNRSQLGQIQIGATSHDLQHQRSRKRRGAPPFLPHGHAQSCQRVPLFVDFEEIGWSGWIISPRGYNAYHCRGSCPFPLGGNLRATNHATVRSIMHALKLSSDDVGAPCCVPDRLQSISLLYFDDDENVVLKQYDDMVALSCGCH